ncbi:MAG TPA: glycosyltransferase [Candidatus Limnocylindria bacterium]|nr:glycosyltransferase [Candidatus Limnocylindria bacterium]
MTTGRPVQRVLQVHTRYREAGGEDRVVDDELRLLRSAGVEVEQIIFDNTSIDDSSAPGRARAGASAVWSTSAARRVRSAIGSFRPDVVHVHNTFVLASPSVFWAASRSAVPVVHTVHNYRLVCPVATCFRDGHPCTDCVGKPIPVPGVVHACVRHSRAQSAVVAATLTTHRAIGTWSRRIDRYIALTDFQRSLLVKGGLPARRISVLANFLEPDPGIDANDRTGFLYLGRLAPEKGIATLTAAAALGHHAVRVAGDGPASDLVNAAAVSSQVSALGRLSTSEAHRAMASSVALLVPSLWFEGFPMVVLEAYASATPVIASRIGSLAEVVEDRTTGLLVPPGDADALAAAIAWAHDHPSEMRAMGLNARRRYEERYRGASHLAALMDIYDEARRNRHAAS